MTINGWNSSVKPVTGHLTWVTPTALSLSAGGERAAQAAWRRVGCLSCQGIKPRAGILLLRATNGLPEARSAYGTARRERSEEAVARRPRVPGTAPPSRPLLDADRRPTPGNRAQSLRETDRSRTTAPPQSPLLTSPGVILSLSGSPFARVAQW